MLQFKPDKMGSYDANDVTFLLRDISHVNAEQTTEQRERKIQSGEAHYSEMLPEEFQPNAQYMQLYEEMLEKYAAKIAYSVAIVSEQIVAKRHAQKLVLVSLARAGTPIGILMKRYIQHAYNIDVPHYSISILRGRGIDETALMYIAENHPDGDVQFVDGWTGKGAISKELARSIDKWNTAGNKPLDAQLAVLADPGHCATLYGTREDFLIPSACLNSTVSGLVSRTVLNEKFLAPGDFHGAKYYTHLAHVDVSRAYIEAICAHYTPEIVMQAQQVVATWPQEPEPSWEGLRSVEQIQQHFSIQHINHIKPGIGETTRVLLRRVPWKILVNPTATENLAHIYLLAAERGVPVEQYADMTYACCGLIKELD